MTKISTTYFSLEDFLPGAEVQVRIGQGRCNAAYVFARARNPLTKKGSRNCIIGLDFRIGNLGQFVLDHSGRRKPLFTKSDIPPAMRVRFSVREIHDIVEAMKLEVLVRALIGMRAVHEIYRLDGDWLIIQAVEDELTKSAERAVRVKRDDRSYNGRPKRDRYRPAVLAA